tara:strand:- start:2854 stop:4107 length:1254 start_codon:yes stop_codon:yes gene_type:complete
MAELNTNLSTEYIKSLRDRVDSFNFKKEQQEYENLLSQYNPQPENYDIYDLATSLSQGLSAQQQTSRPNSVGGGLALGFNQASQDMKLRKESYAKSRQEIGLQATSMALQDEKEATKFLDESLFQLAKASMQDSTGADKPTADIRNVEALVEADAVYNKLLQTPENERGVDYDVNLAAAEARLVGLQTSIGTDAYDVNLAAAKFKSEREGKAPGGVDLSILEKEMDKKFAAMASEYLFQGKSQIQANLGNLNEKINILEEGEQNVSGPVTGLLGDTVKGIFAPEAASFLGDIRDVVFQSLREKLGAQFTQMEGDRLVAAAFNPLLPEAMNIARLKRLYITIEEAARAKEEGIGYFNDNGTIKGYEARPLDFNSIINSIVLSSDYDNMTDDELKKLYKEGDKTEKNAILNLLRQRESK